MVRTVVARSICVVLLAASVACGDAKGSPQATAVVPAVSAVPTTTPLSTPAERVSQPAPVPTAPIGAPRPRAVTDQQWTPFAAVGGITLRHPSRRVERVGFHQSNHEGARELRVLPSAVAPKTLETRGRLTGSRTAADVVTDPDVEIRAPATGRVKRAGTYVLYCEHSDDYVVIEPDDHPGWEVKMLHIDGVRVRPGDRVIAGETVVAPRPTKLPFESDVDETTASPHWPHVHIEVVDPAIPNKPSPGSGC